jgi:hypothetical protein
MWLTISYTAHSRESYNAAALHVLLYPTLRAVLRLEKAHKVKLEADVHKIVGGCNRKRDGPSGGKQ